MSAYEVEVRGQVYKIEIEPAAREPASGSKSSELPSSVCKVTSNGRALSVECARIHDRELSLFINGRSFTARREPGANDTTRVLLEGRSYECNLRDPRSLRARARSGQSQAGEQKLTASMPGKVVRVLAHENDTISIGQGILVIEAMKMQNEVRSPKPGRLKKVMVREGANVNAGEILAILE
jgi:biotin carboxyl carrier protein